MSHERLQHEGAMNHRTSRYISLDFIRILACAMVVLMHSPIPSANASGPFLVTLGYLTAPCIGLFFMVSGALLLPVKTDYVTFIRKRFSKIAIPTLIWSIFYVLLKLFYSESEINVLQSIASVPFSPQGEGVLWFMYALSGIYLLAPILSTWIDKATKKELQIVLSLWLVTLCYPILDFWVVTNSTTSGILYYFTGYAGYFVLGYYLKKYPQSLSSSISWLIAISGIIVLFLLKLFDIEFDFYQLFWYQSIFIAAFCVAIWKTITKLTRAIHYNNTIVKLSSLSFGIYLCHILIMRKLLWHIDYIERISNYPLQTIVVFLLTFLLSIALCELLSRLSFAKWLIGYHHSK